MRSTAKLTKATIVGCAALVTFANGVAQPPEDVYPMASGIESLLFPTISFEALTDGYVPYWDGTGLANSG